MNDEWWMRRQMDEWKIPTPRGVSENELVLKGEQRGGKWNVDDKMFRALRRREDMRPGYGGGSVYLI